MSPAESRLREVLAGIVPGGIALAYSGGVDSSVLLAVLARLRAERPFPLAAVMAESVFQPPEEIRAARERAARLGVGLHTVRHDPLSDPALRQNPPDRCYRCKRRIFAEIRAWAGANGLAAVADGTNADDVRSTRPGLRALRELAVRSPLAEAGLTKAAVRELAAELIPEAAAQPASPCLATRFEYGAALSAERLRLVAEGERIIRERLPEAADVRLRVHGGTGRIEVTPGLIPAVAAGGRMLAARLKELGFKRIVLDLDGFGSGSMERTEDGHGQT